MLPKALGCVGPALGRCGDGKACRAGFQKDWRRQWRARNEKSPLRIAPAASFDIQNLQRHAPSGGVALRERHANARCSMLRT